MDAKDEVARPGLDHWQRRAAIGSERDARHAVTKLAINATSRTSKGTLLRSQKALSF